MPNHTVLYLCTSNDEYGNPRRLYVRVNGGRVEAVVDAERDITPKWVDVWSTVRIIITPDEYQRWLKKMKEAS